MFSHSHGIIPHRKPAISFTHVSIFANEMATFWRAEQTRIQPNREQMNGVTFMRLADAVMEQIWIVVVKEAKSGDKDAIKIVELAESKSEKKDAKSLFKWTFEYEWADAQRIEMFGPGVWWETPFDTSVTETKLTDTPNVPDASVTTVLIPWFITKSLKLNEHTRKELWNTMARPRHEPNTLGWWWDLIQFFHPLTRPIFGFA